MRIICNEEEEEMLTNILTSCMLCPRTKEDCKLYKNCADCILDFLNIEWEEYGE